MGKIRCLMCRDHQTEVEFLICNHCQSSMGLDAVSNLLRDFQQYRVVINSRLSNSKRFYTRMRTGCVAAGFQPVAGPAAVKVIAQQSQWDHGTMEAGHMVVRALEGIGIGEETKVWSVSTTLLQGGNAWTMVECRALLGDELGGTGGVGR